MKYDVIIVGASFAGLSAAMQLGRARKSVLLIDSALPRNRYAAAAHGFLGHDGKAPFALLAEARRQLGEYPSVQFKAGVARRAGAVRGGFEVQLEDDSQLGAARIVLATGVRDELPSVPGMQERWGTGVLHCPYCHGYEVADQPLGVLATMVASVEQAMLIPDWGPTTYFTQGRFEPDAGQLALLGARGVQIERSPVVELLGPLPALESVRLADGRVVELAALFTAPRTHMASPFGRAAGMRVPRRDAGAVHSGRCHAADQCSGRVRGGDAAAPMHNATLASAAGVMAGVASHRSLIAGLGSHVAPPGVGR